MKGRAMKDPGKADASLIGEAGLGETFDLAPQTESAWIEVIHKMESVYADLVHYQVELEQKNAALEEAQQFITSVLAAMTDVLIVCDTAGVIEQVNRALEVLTGRPAQALLRQPLRTLFADESLAVVASFPDRLGQAALADCEVALRCADGSSAPLAMNCSSRFDHDGRLVGMVLIGRPVGELRRAYDALNRTHAELQQTQRQLVHSEKMASLGRLVAGVAHELNNPISFVFGNVHALQRYAGRIVEYLQAVEVEADSPRLGELRQRLKIHRVLDDMGPLIDGTLEGAERVRDIVQELRRFSGGQAEQVAPIDLGALVRKSVEWVVRASRVKPEVDYTLPGALPLVSREGQVHQILVNLVQNATDAMDGCAVCRLGIAAESRDERVEIHVRDTGPGIPEADLTHVFDPFFTSKPVGQGTGLGLYISYGLAEDLGGELRVRNHPDGGAEFTLSLPLARDDATGAARIDAGTDARTDTGSVG